MIPISSIHPDVELRDFLLGQDIHVVDADGTERKVTVYGDWERPTNEVPSDFLVVMLNGDIGGYGMSSPYAEGYIMVSLYSKMNDDGSVKKQRVDKILDQFDHLVEKLVTENYFYKYASPRFITPTTPNVTSGYSVTTLNLEWHTNNNFNKQ